MKRSGVPPFRFHDLRHYCASIQHALGIPDAYIMQRGGWQSDAILKDVYRHTMDDKQQAMNQQTSISPKYATRNATQKKKALVNTRALKRRQPDLNW